MCLCRACWEALSKKLDDEGLGDIVIDRTGEDDLWSICPDCGGGWWMHRVDDDGWIKAFVCVDCEYTVEVTGAKAE